MLKLNIAAIKEGHSTYEQIVPAKDLNLLDNEEFSEPVQIFYDINKVGGEVFVKTFLKTRVHLSCDTCLEAFLHNLQEKVDIILTKDNDLGDREDEDIYLVADSTTEVDITDSARQSLLLAIPFKKKCRDDCKGLCPTCGVNLNHDTCTCAPSKTDARWEALKNISFDKK